MTGDSYAHRMTPACPRHRLKSLGKFRIPYISFHGTDVGWIAVGAGWAYAVPGAERTAAFVDTREGQSPERTRHLPHGHVTGLGIEGGVKQLRFLLRAREGFRFSSPSDEIAALSFCRVYKKGPVPTIVSHPRSKR
jgi:hypothetical protein